MQTSWRLSLRHGLVCGIDGQVSEKGRLEKSSNSDTHLALAQQELWRKRLRLIALKLFRMLRGAVVRTVVSVHLWRRVVLVAALSVAMIVVIHVHFDKLIGRAG
jgi:hypothetical protein